MNYPSYRALSEHDWSKRVNRAYKLLNPCHVCPRTCGVNRLDREDPKLGFCQMKDKAAVFSYNPHFGEEKCLRGFGGSGTIFFSSCNIACVYCQNWEISQLRLGKEAETEELAQMMVSLQEKGCHNINLVTPTPHIEQIIKAISLAAKKGLKIPIVYNTGGYDRIDTLKLLERIVDIYVPDIKYGSNDQALKYSQAKDYWIIVQQAVKEMYRQVGDLEIDKTGIAKKGLLIRHLVLPNNTAESEKVMEFIARKISRNSYVNIMDQYRPEHKASHYSEVNRGITSQEFEKAVEWAKKAGLHRFEHLN